MNKIKGIKVVTIPVDVTISCALDNKQCTRGCQYGELDYDGFGHCYLFNQSIAKYQRLWKCIEAETNGPGTFSLTIQQQFDIIAVMKMEDR